MTYGKWAALGILFALMFGAGGFHLLRRRWTQSAKDLPKTLTAQNERKQAA